jgi:hypothetical protein
MALEIVGSVDDHARGAGVLERCNKAMMTGNSSARPRTGIQFVDIPLRLQQKAAVRFTFLWLEERRWEGKDYVVEVQASVAHVQPRRREAA